MKANSTADITTQSNAIGSIAAQLTANTAKVDAAFYRLLTADQQTKLNSLNNDGFFRPGFGIHVPDGRSLNQPRQNPAAAGTFLRRLRMIKTSGG